MFIRFVLVGGIGFCIDAGITYLLIRLMMAPWFARIPAIAIAMSFTWLANRYFTYKVKNPRTINEAFRYALVAISMALFNYLIYLLLIRYGILPIVSVTMATVCQTLISFHAYQYLVFIKKSPSRKLMPMNHANSSFIKHFIVNFAFLSGITFGCFLLIRGISDPWVGMGDGDGALFSSIARNYLQFGVFELKFGQLTTFEEINHPNGNYYLHHPPLFPILVSIAFYLFGDTEVTARSVSVLATIITGYILFFLVKKSANIRLGILAVFFFMTYPSTIFFGRKPGYEAIVLLFMVLVVFLYQEYKNNPRRSILIYFFISLIAGVATDWAAYFLPIALFVDHMLTQKNRRLDRQLVFGMFFAPIIVISLFMFSIYLVDRNSLIDLVNQGLAYMGFVTPDSEVAKTVVEARITFSIKEYVFILVNNFDTDFGIISILLSLLGMGFVKKNQSIKNVAIILFIVALCPLVVFWRSLYFHIWWLHLLSIPLAIFSAMAVDSMITWAEIDITCNAEKTKRGIVIAICISTFITMGFNLMKLNNWQERLLPLGHYESPSFIKEIGQRIYQSTSIGDEILTNLAKNDRLLPYYSRRLIHSDIISPDEIEKISSYKSKLSNCKIYFLLFLGVNASPEEKILNNWLSSHELVTIFNVDGNELYLFKLK